MKAPGVSAKKAGKGLKRGQALQVMTYPRRRTKALVLWAARDAGLSLSSFMLLASLKEVAALQGCNIDELVPADELKRYRAYRIYPKHRDTTKR